MTEISFLNVKMQVSVTKTTVLNSLEYKYYQSIIRLFQYISNIQSIAQSILEIATSQDIYSLPL